MPFYDDKCKECNHNWKEQQSIDARNDPSYNPCPDCGSSGDIILVMGSPAIGDPVTLGIKKPDKAFQNRLRQIHENVKSVGGDVLGNSTYGHNITE